MSSSDAGLLIQPRTSSVAVVISIPIDNFYSITVLTEKQSIVSLLSSIVGLAGIFSFFGSLLGVVDALYSKGKSRLNRREMGGQEFENINPLRSREQTPQVSKPEEAVPVTAWRRVADGDSVWYVSVETGESAWELPVGGVLEE